MAGPILESKVMHAIFQKIGQKMLKKVKKHVNIWAITKCVSGIQLFVSFRKLHKLIGSI